jgi:tetratricopeptide (TPR) repeat protein
VLLLAGGAYYNARLRVALLSARNAQSRADENARTALDQRNLALKALDQLVYDVQETLGEAPGTRRLRRHLLDTAIVGLDGIARSNETTSPDLSRAVAHEKLGQIFRQVGRAEEGRRQLEQAKGLAEALIARSPHDVAVADCLRKACVGLGQIDISAGRFHEAKGEVRRAVDMAEIIATADPTGTTAMRSLLESYLQLGRAYGYAREFAAADVWLGKTRDMASRWAETDPSNTQAREMLAWSYRKLADIRKFLNDPQGARSDYGKAIAISRALVKDEPGTRAFKIHLGLAIQDLAGVEFRQGNPGTARPLYTESIQLFSELVAADSENVDPYLWLFHAYDDVARLEQEAGRFAEAETYCTQARDHLLRLTREGWLDVRPDFGRHRIGDLDRRIEDCKLVPQALGPLASICTKPPREAARLLLIRAGANTATGQLAELSATVEALGKLRADTAEDLYNLAHSLAASIARIDDRRWPAATAKQRAALHVRTSGRALAVLTLAVDHGFHTIAQLEGDTAFKAIAAQPGYQQILERLKQLDRTMQP